MGYIMVEEECCARRKLPALHNLFIEWMVYPVVSIEIPVLHILSWKNKWVLLPKKEKRKERRIGCLMV
jgi:hypothetical protein